MKGLCHKPQSPFSIHFNRDFRFGVPHAGAIAGRDSSLRYGFEIISGFSERTASNVLYTKSLFQNVDALITRRLPFQDKDRPFAALAR